MNGIGNICLLNVVLFSLAWITGIARQFEDLWEIMPECILVFLILGIFLKLPDYISSGNEIK